MIVSFRDRDTQTLFEEGRHRKFGSMSKVALRKLFVLHTADELSVLRYARGNYLETLKGDRAGEHSIRINDQYRICFTWTEAGPRDVEIVDYH